MNFTKTIRRLACVMAFGLFAAGCTEKQPVPPPTNDKKIEVEQTKGDKAAAKPDPKYKPSKVNHGPRPVPFLPSPETVGAVIGGPAAGFIRKWEPEPDLTTADLNFGGEVPTVELTPIKDSPSPDITAPVGVDTIGGPSGVGSNYIGPGGSMAVPGLQGRSGSTKQKLLTQHRGDETSEAAVARSLAWLARQQNPSDGSWQFDGSAKADRVAATALALLPFLSAGETHKTGKKYKENVSKGLQFLKAQQKPSGQFGEHSTISHALALIAISEAHAMTRDSALKPLIPSGIEFMAKQQLEDGSWPSEVSGKTPDLRAFAWNAQALRSLRLVPMPIEKGTLDRATKYIERLSRVPADRTDSKTRAISLLGQICLGVDKNNDELKKAIELLAKRESPSSSKTDVERLFFSSQVIHFGGGDAWFKTWNPALREILKLQITERTPDVKKFDIGKWEADDGTIEGEWAALARRV